LKGAAETMELHCDDDLVLLEEVEFEQEETAITVRFFDFLMVE